ncbi:mechanosensitive ion channel family protein [Silvimonas iriomotensis]|uniref:mechanosensitive ion channel family protein n=1 Tax=Silvimonas iriomotensis TaxID=449662 RepID=UPI00166689C0|nr:mechanosensitive ion channel domain-containing protein [Silvimonas iriomotensis]
MKYFRVWVVRSVCLLLIGLCAPAFAAPEASSASAAQGTTVSTPSPLSYLNRDIVTFRATVAGISPQERADRGLKRLQELKEADLDDPLRHFTVTYDTTPVTVYQLGDRLLFYVVQEDMAADDHRTFEAFVAATQNQLQDVLKARLEGVHWPNLIHGVIATLIALLLLFAGLWVMSKARKALLAAISRTRRKQATAEVSGFDWLDASMALANKVTQIVATFAAIALIYLWLIYALDQFALTQPVGERLGGFLLDLLVRIARGFVDALPGIITVIVILMITRAVQDVIARVFIAVQEGRLEVPGMHPDTAGATRRMVSVVVWALGLTFAYPYIPGSQSDVFKGLSVLFGFMITLGSAGIVNQLMSGMVLVYSRALRRGDLVAIGDTRGVVTELSTLSVKLTTLQKEEITIPNAVVVGNNIRNFTRAAGEAGSLLSTVVTIGYDTPWRQVHAMLINAAKRNPGLVQQPEPYVVQRGLSDFYVEYELFAHCVEPMRAVAILSVLHADIQDEFNHWGVQIMSPHFRMQPEGAVLVKEQDWYSKPAVPPSGSAE